MRRRRAVAIQDTNPVVGRRQRCAPGPDRRRETRYVPRAMALKITCPHCGRKHPLDEPFPLPGSERQCDCGRTLSITYPVGMIEKLRTTGEQDGRLEELYERLLALLDYLLPQYVAEGKSHLTIAIGCTGGHHRSVAVAEGLCRRYADTEGLTVDVVHRDIDL